MARPRIVRADTLDLQDQRAPSAKDHSKQPSNPPPEGIAPHQELTIRHADQDLKSELMHGPDGQADDYDEQEDMNGEEDNEHRDGSDDGDFDGEDDDLLDDDLMDKISSSPSIDDEDIDFEFVYALHNFVATVEGQANAAKGDTMVLLDDSNSYWWLVRIVKDGSIGYLPAEHIETPTERLARLNKHRNVDLSATMLGDNSEKSKNPLKKAMRRRNAKTVSFSNPTYIEASDAEFVTEDEMEEGDFFDHDEESSRGDEDDDGQDGQHEDIVVEPLKPKAQREKETREPEAVQSESTEPGHVSPEKSRTSEDAESDAENVSKSRNGTVRNTDSFFKDDSAEPKKISLTPNLLRDEANNNNANNNSNHSNNIFANELKESRGSLDTIDRAPVASDKGKDDKKRKEKKPGVFSGLFKRKDKKARATDDEVEGSEKYSGESSRSSPPPKTSLESLSQEYQTSKGQGSQMQKQPSRLQKQPPAVMSPTAADFESAGPDAAADNDGTVSTEKGESGLSLRRVASHEADSTEPATRETISSPTASAGSLKSPSPSQPRFVTSPPGPSTGEISQGAAQNSYDRGPDKSSVMSPPQRFQPRLVTEYQDQGMGSPGKVSPLENPAFIETPGLGRDDSSPGERRVSPLSPPQSPSAETREPEISEARTGSVDSVSETPTWSDASLRSYLEDHNDIHDLFVIVHDKSNIPPAGPDHPITGSLFKEESRRLREMTSSLDEMLVDWIGRRMQGSRLK